MANAELKRSLPYLGEQYQGAPDSEPSSDTGPIRLWHSLIGQLQSSALGSASNLNSVPALPASDVAPLAPEESLSDPEGQSGDGCADADSSERRDTGVPDKACLGLTAGSPVEIVLIDRSEENRVRKLRIDEHMNISYWTEENRTERTAAGVIVFMFVVLITIITVTFAFRNDTDEDYAAVIRSLDQTACRVVAPLPRGWRIWQMALPSTDDGRLNDSETVAYTSFVILSENYDDWWIKAEDGLILTFIKGSQLQIDASSFTDDELVDRKTYFLGDPSAKGQESSLTIQVQVEEDGNITTYIRLSPRGDHLYSVISLHSTQGSFRAKHLSEPTRYRVLTRKGQNARHLSARKPPISMLPMTRQINYESRFL